MRIEGVIPARFDSTRFPGKVLIPIDGTPMVALVYAQAVKSLYLDRVTVATDDVRVRRAMDSLGIPVTVTSSVHRSGSDRVAEIAQSGDADVYVNIQGDEPFIEPHLIEEVLKPFVGDAHAKMSTIGSKGLCDDDWVDPHVVKVRVSEGGIAQDFFRQPTGKDRERCYRHVGLYAYDRDALIGLAQMEPSQRERERDLEQMRALDNAIPIHVVTTDYDSVSIDTPEDLARLEGERAVG